MRSRFLLGLLALTLSACTAACTAATPIPFSVVAGTWHAEGVDLSISPEGVISYRKERIGSRVHLEQTPATNLTTDGFDTDHLGVTMHFKINELPHDVGGGVQKMTVDGQELTREELIVRR